MLTEASPLADVVAWVRTARLPGEVVGRWVWVRFPEPPAPDVRAALWANGFRWMPHRQAWAHRCGSPIVRARIHESPRERYGATPIGPADEGAVVA